MDKQKLIHVTSGSLFAGITLLTPSPLAEAIALGTTIYAYKKFDIQNFMYSYMGFVGVNLAILSLRLIKK